MRHVNYTLRPLTIGNAKPREKAYALTDGGGLLVESLPSSTKTWRFKYHLNGKREKVTRKSELLRSKWDEFDLDAAQWDIPAERMKMGKPHRVFLSRQAVELLRHVHEISGHGEYVLPSIFRGSVPMGDVTLNHFFKRIDFGVSDFSPHGLRGTAATLLREHGFGRDVVELLLAHSEKNATVAAYSHIELAAERKRALQLLADRVDALAAGANVIPLRAA